MATVWVLKERSSKQHNAIVGEGTDQPASSLGIYGTASVWWKQQPTNQPTNQPKKRNKNTMIQLTGKDGIMGRQ